MEARDETRITETEIKFMRRTAKFTWMDYKRNEDMLQELKTETILNNTLKYKADWFKDVDILKRGRILKLLKSYQPHGLRNSERTL